MLVGACRFGQNTFSFRFSVCLSDLLSLCLYVRSGLRVCQLESRIIPKMDNEGHLLPHHVFLAFKTLKHAQCHLTGVCTAHQTHHMMVCVKPAETG